MKFLYVLFISMAMMISTAQAGIIAVTVSTEPVISSTVLSKIDAKTFLSLTPAMVKKMTGKKMKFDDRVVLKIAQKQVKKDLRKGKEVNIAEAMKRAEGNFSIGAFLLGMFLLFIGVLIVYVTEWEDPQVARKSAWRGLISGVLLAVAIIRLVSI